MPYYSHMLYFPNKKPFDKYELRWPSFIGEFIKPIIELNLHKSYWFSFYGNLARFRLLTDQYEQIQPIIENLKEQLELTDKGEEKDLTLVNDLGCPRFIGNDSQSTPEQRALCVLKSLEATCNLVIDSIYKQEDDYWNFEENQDKTQNPTKNHLFSVCHLYHNITGAPGLVLSFKEQDSPDVNVLSYYYFCNSISGGMEPTEVKQHNILM